MQFLLKCLFFRLLAGMAFGVAVFGFWRAVHAAMPFPFLRLCLGGALAVAVFRFFLVRASAFRSFLVPFAIDPATLPAVSGWLYATVVVAGVTAAALVAV